MSMSLSVRGLRSLLAAAPKVAPVMWVRPFAAAAAPEGDFVVNVFKKQQQKFRAYMEAHNKLKIPLDGDEKAIKAYAQQVEAIKTKLEIPSTFKRLGTSLNIAIKSSGAESMRSVLEVAAAARIQMNVGDMDDLDSKLMQSLDKVEKEIDGPLMRGDKKGMALFSKELDVLMKLKPRNAKALEEAVKLEEVKGDIDALKAAAMETMETAKRRDGLEFVKAEIKLSS